jgi:glycosyltransferase involved in cell wall biosynthesis
VIGNGDELLGHPENFRPLSDLQRNQIQVIYPPLDLDTAIYNCEVSNECFTRSSSEPTLLFVGRLDTQKLPTLFIQIAATLLDVKVRIVGDGPLSYALQMKVFSDFHELSRRLVWTGALSHEDTQLEFLKSAQSVFLLTSIFEGVPIVVLEALGTGTPVVTTKCGGIHEIIEDSTWNTVFDENNYIIGKNIPVTVRRYDHASLILINCQSMPISEDMVKIFASESDFWFARLREESNRLGKEKARLKRWKDAEVFRRKHSLTSFKQRWRDIFKNM